MILGFGTPVGTPSLLCTDLIYLRHFVLWQLTDNPIEITDKTKYRECRKQLVTDKTMTKVFIGAKKGSIVFIGYWNTTYVSIRILALLDCSQLGKKQFLNIATMGIITLTYLLLQR